MILDTQNLSECVNLDADRTKSKHWRPISGFQKLISNLANEIQASLFKCKLDVQTAEETSFQHHSLVHFDPCTSANSAVVVYNSQKNQLILFPLTIKMKQATLL